jgi:hypothetical protein
MTVHNRALVTFLMSITFVDDMVNALAEIYVYVKQDTVEQTVKCGNVTA